MHLETYNISQIAELLEASKNVLVIPSPKGGVDTYSSAGGLYNTLISLGKNVRILYPSKVPAGAEGLVPLEDVKNDDSERTLSVSIDYSSVGTTKVRYTNDQGVLTLHLGPVTKDFDLGNIKSTLNAYEFDLVITLGLRNYEDLGLVYNDLRDRLATTKIINIDRSKMNKEYGFVNLIDETASSISALIFNLLFGLQMTPNEKTAKSLLFGMTRGFSTIGSDYQATAR